MDIQVSRSCVAASSGSFVVKFEAAVELLATERKVYVEIVSVLPPDADPRWVDNARESIRRGAESVLTPLGMGATICVRRVVIHPVDFKPAKYEQFTAEEFRRIIELEIG